MKIKYIEKDNFISEKGQVMITTAVLMAGAFLVGTTIAGLILYFSISQASDVISSNGALFAADAGIEKGLYDYFRNYSNLNSVDICADPNFSISGNDSLENGTYYSYLIKFNCVDSNPVSFYIKSVGKAASAERVLERNFNLR